MMEAISKEQYSTLLYLHAKELNECMCTANTEKNVHAVTADKLRMAELQVAYLHTVIDDLKAMQLEINTRLRELP